MTEIDWKKRALMYEEFLVNEYGVTKGIFDRWLKTSYPEELEEELRTNSKGNGGKKDEGSNG